MEYVLMGHISEALHEAIFFYLYTYKILFGIKWIVAQS